MKFGAVPFSAGSRRKTAPMMTGVMAYNGSVYGVLVILGGVLLATLRFMRQQIAARRTQPVGRNAYYRYKVEIGLALLLGLEVLVAADIIKTVALEPNFISLGVLAALDMAAAHPSAFQLCGYSDR